MTPEDRRETGRPDPWGEVDREIAGRPAAGAWLGADEPERFGEEIREHLSRARLASLFLGSPAFMVVLRGPEHEVVNANPAFYRLVGRRRLLGRTAREAFPDLAGKGWLELLDRVYGSGESHVGAGETITLVRGPDRAPEPVHVSFVYEPLLEDDGSPWGILVHGVDLTQRWRARRTLRRRARQQAAVAELGREALEGAGPDELVRLACRRVVDELEVPRSALLELDPEGDQLVLRHGRGWAEGTVGSTVPADAGTPEGRALGDRQPIAVADEAGHPEPGRGRTGGSAGALLAVAVRSGDDEPIGVLAAYADEARTWDQEETDFLQGVAHQLGTAFAWRETERRLATLAENLPGVLYRCRNDRDWTMEYLSEGTADLTGWTSEELIGEDGPAWAELIHPEDREDVWSSVQAAVGEGRPFRLLYRIETRAGEERWVWEQGRAVAPDTAAATGRLEGCILDVTRWKREREAARKERRRAQERYSRLFRLSPMAISVATVEEGRILEVNEAFRELYGWSRDEAAGRRVRELDLWPSSGERERIIQRLREEGELRGIELGLRARDGDPVEILFAAELLEIDGEACMLAVSQDITERKRAERELQRLALRDTLTGLPNRNLFHDRLAHALGRADRRDGEVAVFFLDLDRFKVVNDTLGHPAGDELLGQVASRVRDSFREEDTVARLGGDEFGCLLEGVASVEEVERAASRLCSVFEVPFEVHGTEIHADASVGIALGGADDRPEDLLRFSDVAMYRVKVREGTGYHLFDPHQDEVETHRLHRENELRQAIREDDLRLEFQPTFRLSDRRIIGAEALVRWEHPERGTVSPGDFIPLAEETGLILQLGRWVLEEACRWGARWHRRADDPFTLSVNLSARQHQEVDLHREVTAVAEAAGLPLEALQLEITESVLMSGHDWLQQLRDVGVSVAIDDFGTGYSSLQYLRQLQADVLKVDRSFVADLEVDRGTSVLVRAILLVARHMGIEVVAEGIETEGQLEHLRKLGCPAGQGFHLGRPVSPEAFGELLEAERGG